jgi:Predicted permease
VASDAASIVSQAQGLEVGSLQQASSYLDSVTGFDPELSDRVPSILSSAAANVAAGFSGVMSFAASTLVGITVMVFTHFYLLRDGERLVEWVDSLGFVRHDEFSRFLKDNRAALWSVFEGHVLMALAMAVLVGTGMILAGIPNSFFWTFVMMILGLVPLVGTAAVWAPSVVYLAVSGRILPASLLLVYAGFVTTVGDNLLRPYLVGESKDMHPFYVLLGVIGGVALFGPVGLFVGPPVFSVAKTSLEAVSDN